MVVVVGGNVLHYVKREGGIVRAVEMSGGNMSRGMSGSREIGRMDDGRSPK